MPASLADLVQNFHAHAQGALTKPPANVDEALMRMVVVCGNLWMQGVEPIASEMDLLISKWEASLRWDERMMVKGPLHALRKMREENQKREQGAG
jgi:hypothetical protein